MILLVSKSTRRGNNSLVNVEECDLVKSKSGSYFEEGELEMKKREEMLTERTETTATSGANEAWIALLDRVITGLVFAVVVTLCVPLVNMLYR